MRKWMTWGVVAVAVTWWQLQAGFARCGTVDGGVLLAPLVLALVLLVQGVKRDLRAAFGEQRRGLDG